MLAGLDTAARPSAAKAWAFCQTSRSWKRPRWFRNAHRTGGVPGGKLRPQSRCL